MDRILFEKMTYAEGGLSGAFSSGLACLLYFRLPVGCKLLFAPSWPSAFEATVFLASSLGGISSADGEAALVGARACL